MGLGVEIKTLTRSRVTQLVSTILKIIIFFFKITILRCLFPDRDMSSLAEIATRV